MRIMLLILASCVIGCDERKSVVAKKAPVDKYIPVKPAGKEFATSEFIDNPAKFKGEYLTIPLALDHSENGDLRDHLGKDTWFRFIGPNVSGRVCIFIPEKLKIPNATFLDILSVYFKCCEGKLDSLNIAAEITRR